RSHNLGRDLLVGCSAGQGAFEEAQAGGVAAAAEKALVESLRQVVLILSAAIDNVRDLRSGHACGQQLIKCGPTYRIDYSSQSVLVDRIEKTVVGPAGSILQVLHRAGNRGLDLFNGASTLQEPDEGVQA